MTSPAPFGSIGELLERSLNIRHVYGEPVQRGETTVIPVAKIAYAFGGGGGQAPGRARSHGTEAGAEPKDSRRDAEGAGGGGAVRMTPVGALEIGPDGTRFIHFQPLKPLLGAVALGTVLGWLIARRR
jgi:uncharacterized spore protein YtfJ